MFDQSDPCIVVLNKLLCLLCLHKIKFWHFLGLLLKPLLLAFFLFDGRPLLTAINISLRSEADTDRTLILFLCFTSNKVILV